MSEQQTTTEISLEELINLQEEDYNLDPLADDETTTSVTEEATIVSNDSDDTPPDETDDGEVDTDEGEEDDLEPTPDDGPDDTQGGNPPSEEEEEEEEEETESKNSDLEAYYETLNEYGVLDPGEDFEFDGTPEAMEEAINRTYSNMSRKAAEALSQKLPPQFRELLSYGLQGGRSVEEFLEVHGKGEIDLDNVDLSTVENQRKVVKQYYRETSPHKEEKINRLVDRLFDTNDLETEAEEAVEYLKDIRKKRKEEFKQQQLEQQRAKEEAQRQKMEALASAIDDNPGIQGKRKNSVKSFFFNEYTNDKGERYTKYIKTLQDIASNTEHLAQLGDILLDYDKKKGFSFDRFERKGKSKAISNFQASLEDKISSARSKVKGKKKTEKPSQPEIPWEQVLQQLD